MGQLVHISDYRPSASEQNIRRLIRNLDSARNPPVLIDGRTGLIDPAAVERRKQELYDAPARRQHRARYQGEPLRSWEANHRARANAQACREASEQHNRWINHHIQIEYTPSEQDELEHLNFVMASAPIDPRGKAIWDDAAREHYRIRERVRLRAVEALFSPHRGESEGQVQRSLGLVATPQARE